MVKIYIDIDGNKYWLQDGKYNRSNGPALEFSDGEKQWKQNGIRHRIDGPAVEYPGGDKDWFYQGQLVDCYNQKEFERLIRLRLLW